MTTNTYIDPSDVPAKVAALQSGSDKAAAQKPAFNAVVNAAGVTLTTAQMKGVLDRSGAAAVSDTTATAAALVAAFTPAVGDIVSWRIRNRNTGTLTLAAGTGITLEGTTTIPTVNTRSYEIRFTNVTAGAEAVTVSGISVSAN